jgi:lipid-A-disaccharide synthase-like uncharacterized protein
MQEAAVRMQRIAFMALLIFLATWVPASAKSTTQPSATTQPAETVRQLREDNAALRHRLDALRDRVDRTRIPPLWMAIGFLGQFVFGLRFVVQWIVTERRKRSVVPVVFWYLSLVGTVILLAYSIYRLDPVFMAGFSLNMIIYVRNLYFIRKEARETAS